MKEKKLDLITIDNITIGSSYVKSSVPSKRATYSRKLWDVTLVPCFFEKVVHKDTPYKEGNTVCPKLDREVKTLGHTFTINVLAHLDINNYTQFSEVKKSHPAIAEVLEKRIPKDWFEKANAGTIKARKLYKAKVQKQYDELLKVYTECGSKSDLSTMSDINDLYYCEAAGFMSSMEERIAKKRNPKSLKLSNALQAIRGEDIITCTEG